jgi:hypothetical protein
VMNTPHQARSYGESGGLGLCVIDPQYRE